MSEKQAENNIDDIFRKGVEPLLTEPSDRFWKKAADDIISESTTASEKKATRWRAIAFILAAALLVLGYMTYQTQNGLKDVERQIAAEKEIKNTIPDKISDAKVSPVVSNTTNDDAPVASIKQSHNKNAGTASNKHMTPISKNTSKTAFFNPQNKLQAPPIAYNKPLISAGNNYKLLDAKSGKDELTSQLSSHNLNNDAQSPQTMAHTPNETQNGAEVNQNPSAPVVINTTESSSHPLPDSIPSAITKTPGESPDSNSSKWSISAFFSPNFLMGYKLTSTQSNTSEIENTIKSEKEKFSYTSGVKVEYALSSNISIGAGLGYSSYTFSVAPSYIYAQKQSDGDVGYSLVTSSGVINCPYYGNTHTGDSLMMNASSTRTYLNIPVLLKYYIHKSTRFKFYAEGGIETNIAIGQTTSMSWQDSWRQGESVVEGAEGAQQMYYCYEAAIGMEYKAWRRLSFYMQPGITGAITSIDRNTPVVSYPRQGSLAAGITYYFR